MRLMLVIQDQKGGGGSCISRAYGTRPLESGIDVRQSVIKNRTKARTSPSEIAALCGAAIMAVTAHIQRQPKASNAN